MRPPPRREEGTILLNVLLFVAIAAGIVALMIAGRDVAFDRTQRLRDAARAQAAAHGGELSAITALRRDMVAGPAVDTRAEPWAALSERGAKIDGGTFDLAIVDAQGRFNINTLARGDLTAIGTFLRIVAALGLPQEMAPPIVAYLRTTGPVSDLGPLAQAGVPPAILARVSALVTALPGDRTTINVNAVGEELLGILIADPLAARRLVEQRRRAGFLTPQDFALQSVPFPPGLGFTSELFLVRTRVTIGDTAQDLTSLLLRRRLQNNVRVDAVARWRGPSAIAAQTPGLEL